MAGTMRWVSSLSRQYAFDAALEECLETVHARLGGAVPHAVIVTLSMHHSRSAARLPALLRARLPEVALIGCLATGVVGAGREVEDGPALSITAASLPGGVSARSVHVSMQKRMELGTDPAAWRAFFHPRGEADAPAALVMLADVGMRDFSGLLRALDEALPDTVKVGGTANGGQGAPLLATEGPVSGGAVALVLRGALQVDTLVAQGCRPLGDPMIITRCSNNEIQEFDRGKPLAVLKQIHAQQPPEERTRLRERLHVGVEMCDQREYRQGDFLIRDITGVDETRGTVRLSVPLEMYQVAQFHVRDGRAAEEDLRVRLDHYVREVPPETVTGALMFTCVARGEKLFGEPDHDAEMFRARLGEVPLGGMFCAGEVGPVNGNTFVHAYTTVFAMFRAR